MDSLLDKLIDALVDGWCGEQGTGAYGNLESHMNWVKGAWNDRPWTIAQGEGLFKHADANNFGGGFGS